MSIDLVQSELERLFSLEEMTALSADLLGFDATAIGGAVSKASFARALMDRCIESDAVDALVDAVIALRSEADPRLRDIKVWNLPGSAEIKPGETFGPFVVTRKLGEGPRAVVYAATKDGAPRTLKVFRRDVIRDARAVQRFLTRVRLVSKVKHENLPDDLEAGLADGRPYVAYSLVEGQPLAARIARTGPLHINEARNLLRGILAALSALHQAKLAHGALRLDNVIVGRGEGGVPRPVLVDAGGDRLGSVGAEGGPWGTTALVKAMSPEQIRGASATPASDLYAFGALLFEVLSGKPLFSGDSPVDVAIAHISQSPPLPSSVAPRGWVSKELDDLCARLLDKIASERPKDARTVLEALEPIGKPAAADAKIAESDLNDLIDVLLAVPSDPEAALTLEGAIEQGADAARVAEAFTMAADQVEPGEEPDSEVTAKEVKRGLLMRAARIYEVNAKDFEKSETVLATLLDQFPTDEVAFALLEQIRRDLGKHEELVEMHLARSEREETATERARSMNKIGRLYVRELEDKEQGVFAFAQALAQDPHDDDYAVDLERAAGSDMKLWAEALQILSQATMSPQMAPEPKIALFTRLGNWYSEKIARPDMGLPCFQAVLAADPAHDGAVEGIGRIYRRAQQWQELGQVLLSRADRAPTAAQARDFRAEAADVLDTKLNDQGRARDLYEQIFAEDPGHTRASEALARIYQHLDDHAGYAKILERRVEALKGEERVKAICRLAELYEDQLNDLPEATRQYEAALELDPQSLTALRGLDRIFNRTGKYKELISNLERQIAISATPRQKINLYERLAGIYDEEFLDHVKSAEALEAILQIDSAHESSLVSLVRHYRALDRWEDVANAYDKHLRIITDEKRRVDALLALGRTLVDHIGSPERARKAYEKVLEIDPNHGGALESLASVNAATGDAMAALTAVESLAAKATTPESRADLWIRAAKILDDKGDKDGAIERYKKALDAQPGNHIAGAALRATYLARGDATSTVELIAREVDVAEGNLAKARLYGEMALLIRDRLKDTDRAREMASKAIDLDPTSMMGLLVTGDIAFEAGRFIEASKAFESLANRVDALPKDQGVRMLIRYVDALSKSGSTEKAVSTVPTLLGLAPDDPDAISRAAQVSLDAKQHKEAANLYADLLNRFSDRLRTEERGAAMLRLGEARFGAREFEDAILPLLEAADLDPDSPVPINLLCKVYEAKKDWEEVVRLKTRRIDVLAGDERSAVLLEIGEIIATQIGDRTRAAKSYVAALDERPDDRRILTKLMQLYSEEKDWSKLVEIVMKLAAKIDDKKQKAKYLHTAASITARQLGDLDRAVELYDQVLDLDPQMTKALTEAIDIRRDKGDHKGVEKLLQIELERATEEGNNEKMLATFEALGVLYKDKMGSVADAIDAYEAAQTLDPDNHARNELLASLYASDPAQYLEKAVAAQGPILRRDPYRPDPYRLLRKLYTESKRADAAWCLCQALVCMGFAEPDEERFFRRMRSESVAPAQSPISEDTWAKLLMHPDADPLVTSIFTVIEPAVLRKNGQSLDALGYQLMYALDLDRHPYPMSQTIRFAAGVLGMEPPLCFQNPGDPGGLSFLHAHTPAVVLGAAALVAEIPTQAAAFIATRHLTYYRPGLYLRHLVPTGTGLRAWLFAAIKLISPSFPVSAEMEGTVKQNLAVLEPTIVGPTRDQLASVVTKLLQAGAIDLKKWVAAVDLSADRAGFIVGNDLELAQEMIKGADEASSAVPQKDRLRELILFAAHEDYFALRRQIGIHIDA